MRHGGRQTRRCGQCYELMDVRARICPHCRSRVPQSDRETLTRLGVMLVLALTAKFWLTPFCFGFGRVFAYFGEQAFKGIAANHMQDAKAPRSVMYHSSKADQPTKR